MAKDCFTLVYDAEPRGFTCKPNLDSFRKAIYTHNRKSPRKITVNLGPKEMEGLNAFGAMVQKGNYLIHNDAGELNVRSRVEGHVLAIPKIGDEKIPRAALRSITGVHDTDLAREKARERLSEYSSGEITPFLGPEGERMDYHFDRETVGKNQEVRFYNGSGYAVMMPYGDAYRMIQSMHGPHVKLTDYFPRQPPNTNTKKPLFISKFRQLAFEAEKRKYEKRAQVTVDIPITSEQMEQLRKKDAEIEIGEYVLRHRSGMLHVYENREGPKTKI